MFEWRKSRWFQEAVILGCGLYFIAGGATMIARCSFWRSDLVMGDSGGLRAGVVKAVLGTLFDSIGMVSTGILAATLGAIPVVVIGNDARRRRRAQRPSARKEGRR